MRLLLVFAICPLCTGCIVYGVPRLDCTPTLPTDVANVRAFRVVDTYDSANGCARLEKREVFEVPHLTSLIPSQWNLHFEHGYGAVVPPGASTHKQRLSVALYRPGYEIAWLEGRSLWSGEPRKPVEWKKIDAAAQRIELEKLVPIEKHWTTRVPFGGPPFGPWTSEPASITPGLRAFLDAERARLAELQ